MAVLNALVLWSSNARRRARMMVLGSLQQQVAAALYGALRLVSRSRCPAAATVRLVGTSERLDSLAAAPRDQCGLKLMLFAG